MPRLQTATFRNILRTPSVGERLRTCGIIPLPPRCSVARPAPRGLQMDENKGNAPHPGPRPGTDQAAKGSGAAIRGPPGSQPLHLAPLGLDALALWHLTACHRGTDRRDLRFDLGRRTSLSIMGRNQGFHLLAFVDAEKHARSRPAGVSDGRPAGLAGHAASQTSIARALVRSSAVGASRS